MSKVLVTSVMSIIAVTLRAVNYVVYGWLREIPVFVIYVGLKLERVCTAMELTLQQMTFSLIVVIIGISVVIVDTFNPVVDTQYRQHYLAVC